MSEDGSIASHISMYTLPSGRRSYALTKVLALAKAGKHKVLEAPIEAAIEANEACRSTEKAWVAQSGKQQATVESARLRRLDARLDKAVTGLRDAAATELEELGDEDEEEAAQLRGYLDRNFPKGARVYTNIGYVEEYAAVTDLVKDLKAKEADVIKYLELGRRLDRIAKLLPKYKAAIDESDVAHKATWKAVTNARGVAHEALMAVVGVVVGTWWRAADADTRNALLAPIVRQNAKVAEARRGRREVDDIDPATGEVVDVVGSAPVVPAVDPLDAPG